jgi:hypothetical protein
MVGWTAWAGWRAKAEGVGGLTGLEKKRKGKSIKNWFLDLGKWIRKFGDRNNWGNPKNSQKTVENLGRQECELE